MVNLRKVRSGDSEFVLQIFKVIKILLLFLLKNEFYISIISNVLLNRYFSKFCCWCWRIFFFSVLSYNLFSYEKNLQKPFIPFNQGKKLTSSERNKKESVVSTWPFSVCCERKLESVWLKESVSYLSKPSLHLSFYLLYFWSMGILDVYMVESGLCDWCINYHGGNGLQYYHKFQTVEWLCRNKGQFIHLSWRKKITGEDY